MEIVNNLLLWTHLAALVAGGAATIGLAVVGVVVRTASVEARAALFRVTKILTRVGRDAYVVSISTGPLMFKFEWEGSAPEMAWFLAKMSFVGILLVIIVATAFNNDRALKGEDRAIRRTLWWGLAGAATLLAIVLCAIFAFEY